MITYDKKEEWLYYWALYHVVVYATAFVAVVVLLGTFAFGLSGGAWDFQKNGETGKAIGALYFLWGGEMYPVCRMIHLGNYIGDTLGKERMRKVETLAHPKNQWVFCLAASVITGVDIWLVRGKFDGMWVHIVILLVVAVFIMAGECIYCWYKRRKAQVVGMGEMRRA